MEHGVFSICFYCIFFIPWNTRKLEYYVSYNLVYQCTEQVCIGNMKPYRNGFISSNFNTIGILLIYYWQVQGVHEFTIKLDIFSKSFLIIEISLKNSIWNRVGFEFSEIICKFIKFKQIISNKNHIGLQQSIVIPL